MSKLDNILDEYGEELLELVAETQDDPVQMLKEIQENGKTYKQQIKELMLEVIGENFSDWGLLETEEQHDKGVENELKNTIRRQIKEL